MTLISPPQPAAYPRATPVAGWCEADRMAWLHMTAPSFLDDTASPAASWSQRQKHNAELDAGRFVSWLAGSHESAFGAASLAACAHPQTLASFARAELARGLKATSVATAASNIVGVASSIAPDRNWEPARVVLNRLKVHGRKLPPTPRHLVHPDDLYGLGLRLMEGAFASDGAVRDPDAWQDGLMVALLIAAPMRISNFAALIVGRHLRQAGSEWVVALPEEETKTRRADEWPLPPGLAPYVDVHLQDVRPALIGRARHQRDTGALWLGSAGQPLGPQGVRKRLTARTTAAFGSAVLPHSFRHIAATAFVLDHPDRPREAAALLGHASPATTERHYVFSQRHLALKALHRMMDGRGRSPR